MCLKLYLIFQTLDLLGAENSPNLLCMKILGDIIMLGGTDGYIGVAIVGAPARYRTGVTSPTSISKRGVCEVMCRQYEGHCPGSHVLCITSSIVLEAFAAGDSFGGVSLWKQRQRTGTSFLGSLKGRSLGGQQVTSLVFTPNNKYLVVGTVARLLLLGIVHHNDSSIRLDGLCELDACPISFRSFYAVSFRKIRKGDDDAEREEKVVVWKVISDVRSESVAGTTTVAGNERSLSTLYRFEWPISVIEKAAQDMEPIVRY